MNYFIVDRVKRTTLLVGFLFITLSLCAQNGKFPFFDFAKIYDFGEIMPKDQGGKFVQVELLNSESDAIIVHKIRSGVLNQKFGTPIDWVKYEKSELETSVWINRLYFLPSFARMYYLTKDKSYVTDMISILKVWIEDNPRIPGLERNSFNWRDMQVAWRSIHLSWCYYLTQDALSDSEKELFFDIQEHHAQALLSWFAKQPLNDFNHQSHGALAMLYLSTLFNQTDLNGQLQSNAIRILTHHLDNAHYNDGGNIEQMFGYFPFQTSIFRDMYLLCSANNIEYPQNLLPMLHKMTNYISQLAQPNQTMPPLNDSYAMGIIPSIEILNSILGTNISSQSKLSAYYPDTQIAVMRSESNTSCNSKNNNSWYLLLNPAKRVGSHSHAGRLGIYLWFNERPILIEAGCSNYDKPIKNSWYRTSKAHNTVLIDGIEDAESSSDVEYAKKRDTENRITEWVDNSNYKFCKMVSPASDPTNVNVKWERSVALVKDEFAVIYDSFSSSKGHKYETLLHIPPVELYLGNNSKAITLYNDSIISIIPVDRNIINNVEVTDQYFYLNGEDLKAPMINYTINSKGDQKSVFIILPKSANSSMIKIQKRECKDGLGLLIKEVDGQEKILLFKNSESSNIELFGKQSKKPFELFINN